MGSHEITSLNPFPTPHSPLPFFISNQQSAIVSPRHARSPAFHDPFDFGQGGHRSVSWRGHRQRAVSRAVFDRGLRPLLGQETVNQSRRERITAADAVEDFKVLAQPGLIELAVAITDR